MLDAVKIKDTICLNPEFLNSNIDNHIFDKIKECKINDCSKENGYIINIRKLLKILDNNISKVNCDLIFTVIYEADVLKPEIGKIFTDNVCMVFSSGLFVNVMNKFKVLIPINYLENYLFENNYFINSINKNTIKEGDKVKFEITGIKYSKKQFNCIAKILF
jgi:DNA-directed RNA polymerase subunit E'/Rpb7